MAKGTKSTQITYPTFLRVKKILNKFISYILLCVLFVFLAGHENSNPRIGNSHVDFYLSESQHLLEIQSKANYYAQDIQVKSTQNNIEELTNEFYHLRNYSPAWTINFSATENLNELIALIDSAEYLGLPESIINTGLLKNYKEILTNGEFQENKIGQRINLELEATQLAFYFMIYLNKGIVKSDTTNIYLSYINQLPSLLNTCLQKNNLSDTILSLQPKIEFYRSLVELLPSYLELMAKVNKTSNGIAKPILAKAFYFTGTISKPNFDSLNTSKIMIAKFQKKHGLNETGILNLSAIEVLREELAHRYNLIALNIDRIRKINIESDNYLFVNIPSYKLHVFANSTEEKTFNVVVGKKHTPTPVISSKLEKIITNPYWTVPKSIAYNEMLSKIRTDSSYLEKHRYFIINGREEPVDATSVDWTSTDPLGKKYWIRQNNGVGNALGKVKFVFPNNNRVYLHDTPSKRFFNREKRAYSHGCIRVQHPQELAQYLSDKYYAPDNDSVNINKSIASRNREVFEIAQDVEVHIQYLTCSVLEDKSLVFHSDLYNKDKNDLEELFSIHYSI